MVLPSSVGKQPNQAVLHTAKGLQAFFHMRRHAAPAVVLHAVVGLPRRLTLGHDCSWRLGSTAIDTSWLCWRGVLFLSLRELLLVAAKHKMPSVDL
jgi:hypothetical protein